MIRFRKKECAPVSFARPKGMDPVIYELLLQRGIASEEEAEHFLNPSVDDLCDPLLLSDMGQAVDMIRSAISNRDRICVYGDYDADGVCASAIMSILLKKMGAEFEIYIPSRHNEGYGLNMEAVEAIASRGTSLLVTVDCGISCHAEIEHAKELGMSCIVTDHHRPGELLPECPVVNPLLNDYPFPKLCGAGVAFKLTDAILGREAAMDVSDIAAVATVADIVSLTGENRAIVRIGLDAMNRCPRPGIRELIRNAGIEGRAITSSDIAYKLAPRLNAGGRIDSARTSFELLTAEDEFEAVTRADALEQANRTRKSLQDEIGSQAMCQLADLDFSAHSIIMIRGKNWNHGVIGLAAAQLQKTFNFPVIVFAEKDGLLTGSCRSIPGIDIFKALSSAADLMVKFGGHAQAAGLTIKAEDFDQLWERLDAYIASNADPECFVPVFEYDMDLPISKLDIAFVNALDALEPVGCDNPFPVFRTEVELLEKRAVGVQKKHLQLIAAENGTRMKGICFGEGSRAGELGDRVEILYVPGLNEWQGNVNVEMQVSAIRNADPLCRITAADADIQRLENNFLTDIVYNKRYPFSGNASSITEEALEALLRETQRGVYLICGNTDTAREWYEKIGIEQIDFSAGCFPNDRQGFNSIVLLPSDLDALPRSVHTLVFVDMPAPDISGNNVEVFEYTGGNRWKVSVPDIAQMREVYKAARRIACRPMRPCYPLDMDTLLSEACGLPVTACTLSRLALMDMHLLELSFNRGGYAEMTVPPAQKTDPQSSEVWRNICLMKNI